MENSGVVSKKVDFSFAFDKIEILGIFEQKKRKINGISCHEWHHLKNFIINKEIESLYDYYKYLVSFRDGRKSTNEVLKAEGLQTLSNISKVVKIEFVFDGTAYFVVLDLSKVTETLATGSQRLFSSASLTKTENTKKIFVPNVAKKTRKLKAKAKTKKYLLKIFRNKKSK